MHIEGGGEWGAASRESRCSFERRREGSTVGRAERGPAAKISVYVLLGVVKVVRPCFFRFLPWEISYTAVPLLLFAFFFGDKVDAGRGGFRRPFFEFFFFS